MAERERPVLFCPAEIAAPFILGEESDGIDPGLEDVKLERVGAVDPRFIVSIPAACFEDKANRHVLGDPAFCGVEILVVGAEGQEDVTDGLLHIDGKLRPKMIKGVPGWRLDVDMSFEDVRTINVDPDMLPLLGSAPTVRLQIADDPPEETRHLLDSIDTSHVVGLRDRALIALMVYTFARLGAVITMKVEDFFPKGKRCWVRLDEKGGKHHKMPAHHNLEAHLDAYLDAAGIPE